jgi:hypothetical protein
MLELVNLAMEYQFQCLSQSQRRHCQHTEARAVDSGRYHHNQTAGEGGRSVVPSQREWGDKEVLIVSFVEYVVRVLAVSTFLLKVYINFKPGYGVCNWDRASFHSNYEYYHEEKYLLSS